MKKQWSEILWYDRWLKTPGRIVRKGGIYSFDLYATFMSRSVIGLDDHSSFLHNDKFYVMIHTPDRKVDTQRSILINFRGSQNPARRMKALDLVRPFFQNWGKQPGRALPNKSAWYVCIAVPEVPSLKCSPGRPSHWSARTISGLERLPVASFANADTIVCYRNRIPISVECPQSPRHSSR